jgi:acyl-CoA synthetase (AMP-forming)/AMP-acid ligase II
MTAPILPFKSLVEPVIKRVKRDPEQLAVIFIEDDESEAKISIGQLHSSACTYARIFHESGIKPGDTVIIATGHSQDLLFAFWGTLFTGAVPSVFAYKGPMSTTSSYLERLKDMIRNSGAQAVITPPNLTRPLQESLSSGTGCRVLSTGDVTAGQNDLDILAQVHSTSGEQIAYLQYTSGTTGMQKGVELSHQAIIHFVQAFAKSLHIKNNDVIVNWLPLYHDFGLFAGFISPLFFERPSVLISPFKWVRYPKIFLEAIHNHKGTICFLPNSAHNHTIRYVSADSVKNLDLSSLRVLINGAEPILLKSQETFLERFAPNGFRESALASGYGMAENTLGVTFSPVGHRAPVDWIDIKEMQVSGKAVQAPPNAQGSKANVGSGVPLEGTEVAIVDEEGNHLPGRNLGEIIIRSPSLFSGYHSRPDLTEQVMRDGWYFSGDLGYLVGRHLYVCGRKKDLVIVGGHNIHPEDIETAAAAVPGVFPPAVVAFGIPDETTGTEKVILVCGLERPLDDSGRLEIEKQVRRRVFNELEVTPGEIHLVKKNWVVRTHNGKIARGLNREKYKKELQ